MDRPSQNLAHVFKLAPEEAIPSISIELLSSLALSFGINVYREHFLPTLLSHVSMETQNKLGLIGQKAISKEETGIELKLKGTTRRRMVLSEAFAYMSLYLHDGNPSSDLEPSPSLARTSTLAMLPSKVLKGGIKGERFSIHPPPTLTGRKKSLPL